jgi:hypothetical protein
MTDLECVGLAIIKIGGTSRNLTNNRIQLNIQGRSVTLNKTAGRYVLDYIVGTDVSWFGKLKTEYKVQEAEKRSRLAEEATLRREEAARRKKEAEEMQKRMEQARKEQKLKEMKNLESQLTDLIKSQEEADNYLQETIEMQQDLVNQKLQLAREREKAVISAGKETGWELFETEEDEEWLTLRLTLK